MSEVTHLQELEARLDVDEVVIEPPEINGVRGFEIRMSSKRAKDFGNKIVGLAIQAMPGRKRESDIG